MTDEKIIQLYFNRDEKAIEETSINMAHIVIRLQTTFLEIGRIRKNA